jgi:hypothetical protein
MLVTSLSSPTGMDLISITLTQTGQFFAGGQTSLYTDVNLFRLILLILYEQVDLRNVKLNVPCMTYALVVPHYFHTF